MHRLDTIISVLKHFIENCRFFAQNFSEFQKFNSKLPSNWLRYEICCGEGTGMRLGSFECEPACWFFCCCAAKHCSVRTNTPSSSFSSISFVANFRTSCRFTVSNSLLFHHTLGFQASSVLRGRGKTKNTHYNYRKNKNKTLTHAILMRWITME